MDRAVKSLEKLSAVLSTPKKNPKEWTASKSSKACKNASDNTRMSMVMVIDKFILYLFADMSELKDNDAEAEEGTPNESESAIQTTTTTQSQH